MKVIYNKFIPFKGFVGINLFGTLFVREEYRERLHKHFSYEYDRFLNHEMIHTAQMKELLYIPFYVIYLIEFIIWSLYYGNCDDGYRNISFEREAYDNDGYLDYLETRKWLGMWRR